MKRAFLFLLALLACAFSGTILAQNIVIGEKAPELKNVLWLADKAPAASDYSLLIFFHSSNRGCFASIDNVQKVSKGVEHKFKIIVITQEEADKIAPLLTSYLSERFGVAFDHEKKIFANFGVQFVPFGVTTDAKNRVQWMGNPQTLTNKLIIQIIQ